jgi:hypothetical protein
MKFEFGDLYRFIVSLGMFLISSAFVFPWLFLKEKLELNTDSICKIQSLDCDVAHTKKEIIYYTLKLIPFISPAFFIAGILVVIFGVLKWRRNQLLLDEQIKIEHDLKQASLRPATEDETIEKYRNEIIESEPEVNNMNNLSERVSVWERMEDKVAEKLTNSNVGNGLERNVSIANHEVDFIIKRNYFRNDCLVEVKYIRRGFNFSWLKEVFLKHRYKKSLYEQFRGKKASTLLLILIEDAAFKKDKYEKLQTRLIESNLDSDKNDKIKIIPVSQFLNIEASKMESVLFC